MQTRRQHTPQQWIAAGVAVFAIALAACGSNTPQPGADVNASAPSRGARADQTTSARGTVRLPDLRDPATRKQFVCSFADGYFSPPPTALSNRPSDCK